MKKVFILTFLLSVCFAHPAHAVNSEIIVDSIKIIIPAPEGFVDVTNTEPEMIAEFKNFVAPGSRFQALLIPFEDMLSKNPYPVRYLSVQTNKLIESQEITSSSFVKGRQAIRANVEETLGQATGDINQYLSQVVEGFDMEIGEIKYVPFESESENHIAFSSLSKYSMGTDSEKTDVIMAGSWAMVLSKNRLININVYSIYNTVGDLEWTQNTLVKWAAAIIEANPSLRSSANSNGVNWGKSAVKGLIQALTIAVLGVIIVIYRKSKKTQ